MTPATSQNLATLQSLSDEIATGTKTLASREAEVEKMRAELSARAQRFAILAHLVREREAAPSKSATPVQAQPSTKNGSAKPAVQKSKARKAKRAKGIMRYRDPATGREWSGFGTVPGFIKESGKDKSAFLITQPAA